jgi:asparagine synthase (glutamine-hydrolysing)
MAMERLLPEQVAHRPKHGFSTPYDDWLRASLGEEVERRYAPGEPLAGVVAPDAVRRLVGEHRRGRADHKSVLYCLLELSEWHHAFVEAREPVAA